MTHTPKRFGPFTPSTGPLWLPEFSRSIANLFRQEMPGPFTFHGCETTEMPTAADYPGSLMYDTDMTLLAYSNGTAWQTLEPSIAAGTTAQYYRGDKTWQTLNGLAVANTPAGNIASTTVQAAINELDTEKEPSITAGTTAQYWRGDKSWQTLDKAAVGLANVDNTSDASKPVSTATQAALDFKANLASPTFTGTLAAAAATFSGNVTIGDATTDSHTINGPFIVNTAATPFEIHASTGNAIKLKMTQTVAAVKSTVGWIGCDATDHFNTYNPAGTKRWSADDTGFKLNSTKIIGARGAAVADATDAASAITQLNALLARCRTHGLIAP